MDGSVLVDQQDITNNNSLQTQDAVKRTCRERWTIVTEREREFGKSVRAVGLDDDGGERVFFNHKIINALKSKENIERDVMKDISRTRKETMTYRKTQQGTDIIKEWQSKESVFVKNLFKSQRVIVACVIIYIKYLYRRLDERSLLISLWNLFVQYPNVYSQLELTVFHLNNLDISSGR